MRIHLLIREPLFSCLGKERLVTVGVGRSCSIEVAQGVGELESLQIDTNVRSV